MEEKEQNITANLTKKELSKLFKMLCKHLKEYKADKYFPDIWQKCSACILNDVPWVLPGSKPDSVVGKITRDLCFAIWHEGILDERIER